MPINFTCPHCGTATLVADQFIGHAGPCSSCGETVTIPGQRPPTSQSPYQSPAYQSPPPPIEDSAAMRMLVPVGRSLWAILAGYLGLFSILIIPAPLALLFGILAVRDIRQNKDKHGMGRAVFGIVMGALGTAFLLFGIVMILSGY